MVQPRKPAIVAAHACAAGFLLAAVGVFAGGASAGAPARTLWASPSGTGATCSASAPCSLGQAVSSAANGQTVHARPGTYTGGVIVTAGIDLVGNGATIDATGSPNGIQVLASDTTIEGFAVENATFEGILVGNSSAAASGSAIAGVTIDNVDVTNNDQGLSADPQVGECASTPGGPGDCGEGIHLNSVTNSVIEHSTIADNAGGILMTDEFGPNSNNVIEHNMILDNADDCGVTLASHTGNGVFDNTVEFNVADGNGVAGQGAGYLIAGGGPNTAAYGNVIEHNEASGNGLAGVTIHAHFVGNFNDNVIEFNALTNNNVDGDDDFATQDNATTDIVVASGPPPGIPPFLFPSPIGGTIIEHNTLDDAQVGIWTLNVDPSSTTIDKNSFGPGIGTPVSNN